MSERQIFWIKEQKPTKEVIKIVGIQIVDQMTIPTIEGINEKTRQEINIRACGAALIEMMSQFWYKKGRLPEITTAKQALYEVFGVDLENDFHQGDPDTHIYPVLGCTVEALAKAGRKIGLQGSEFFYHQMPEQILANIENGFPTIVEVGARDTSKNKYDHWQSPSGKEYWQLTNGHFVLVTGFEKNTKTGDYQKIYVADTLNYRWFKFYTAEEFKRAAYITSDDDGHRYYWGQGAILKP